MESTYTENLRCRKGSPRCSLISGFNSKSREAQIVWSQLLIPVAISLIVVGYPECFPVTWIPGALTRAGEVVTGGPNPRHNEQLPILAPGNRSND